MPYRESPSPARRPQLIERSSSAHSLSRASPSNGKGSTTKLHKAHPVGHGRHLHGRVSSQGKNLNKLSKIVATHPQEDHAKSKAPTKIKVQTPSTSPSTANLKSNTSNVGLARTGSKVSVKRNTSNLSQKRNKSSGKLGNLNKSKKGKADRNGYHDADASHVQFSVGSDDPDDGWTEADSSQSPGISRRDGPGREKIPYREPPSPDGPQTHSRNHLPASPPESPPAEGQEKTLHASGNRQNSSSPHLGTSDAEAVTNRLLNRNTAFNAKPQTSAISATISPSGSSGSPAFIYSQDATLRNEQSMPADGISRFLNATESSSGSATTGSLSHLHARLSESQKEHERSGNVQSSPGSPNANMTLDSARRARSAANLTTHKPGSSRSSSPSSQRNAHSTLRGTHASPFASARDHQSLTQLKIDLQRMSTNREEPHAPAVTLPISNAPESFKKEQKMNSERSTEERNHRLWDQAEVEYRNGRRFIGVVGKGLERLEKRGKIGGLKEGRDDARERNGGRKGDMSPLVSTSADSRPESRGRIRFEIGRSFGDERSEGDAASDGGGLEGLLRRMWEGDGQSGAED
ncbi:MAG: hypothetical protein Q9220_000587 [cf. Caloplaca sp. 1 TL-2023]